MTRGEKEKKNEPTAVRWSATRRRRWAGADVTIGIATKRNTGTGRWVFVEMRFRMILCDRVPCMVGDSLCVRRNATLFFLGDDSVARVRIIGADVAVGDYGNRAPSRIVARAEGAQRARGLVRSCPQNARHDVS